MKTREELLIEKSGILAKIAKIEAAMEKKARLEPVYENIQALKHYYKTNVKDARKDVIKDSWFTSGYSWKGSNFQSFQSVGKGDLKSEINDFNWNWSEDGIDNILNDLNREIRDCNFIIYEMFGPIGGLLKLLDAVATEIENLVD